MRQQVVLAQESQRKRENHFIYCPATKRPLVELAFDAKFDWLIVIRRQRKSE